MDWNIFSFLCVFFFFIICLDRLFMEGKQVGKTHCQVCGRSLTQAELNTNSCECGFSVSKHDPYWGFDTSGNAKLCEYQPDGSRISDEVEGSDEGQAHDVDDDLVTPKRPREDYERNSESITRKKERIAQSVQSPLEDGSSELSKREKKAEKSRTMAKKLPPNDLSGLSSDEIQDDELPKPSDRKRVNESSQTLGTENEEDAPKKKAKHGSTKTSPKME